MKKIVFVDNDSEGEKSKNELQSLRTKLSLFAGVPIEQLEQIERQPSFYFLSKKEAGRIILDPETVILTWSMYTANHYDSLYQMIDLLVMAGKQGIKGKVYLDGSAKLKSKLTAEWKYIKKDKKYIKLAIENNFIIDLDSENGFGRIRINDKKEPLLKVDRMDILPLLS